MRKFLVIAAVLISMVSFGQKIEFKVEGYPDTTINLVRYSGKGIFYADTAEIKNGFVSFDGSKQKAGMLALYLPGEKQQLFEFFYNDEDVLIETKLPAMLMNAKVKKSEENKIFVDYLRFLNSQRTKMNAYQEQLKKAEKDSKQYETIRGHINETTDEVVAYQNDIINKHPDMLVARFIKMSQDIEIPKEAPATENGEPIDSNWRFKYYRAHYWDNLYDFKDDRLVRNKVYGQKLEKYFSKSMMIQHWDTVLYYAYDLCDRLDPKSEMFQYTVSWITSTYEKSKIMGMDKVFVGMAQRYYCARDAEGKRLAHWVKPNKLDELCDRAFSQRNLVMGVKPPNVRLLDSTNRVWHDYYSLDNEYTILYFWDPECGHCKKVTPKLQTLYSKKFRDRNIDIFAVGKAVGEDFGKWKKFIKKHNLEFINVAVTDSLFQLASDTTNNQQKLKEVLKSTTIESLNYQKTFDIFSTPKVLILDKDKKIIGKSLSVGQMEEFLDKLQGKEDVEKLFPVEEEPEDEKVH